MTAIDRRYDFLLLFDVTAGNPNGDPDMDNEPRRELGTDLGLVSDVCLKRKVRNCIEVIRDNDATLQEQIKKGLRIHVVEGAVLNDAHNEALERAGVPLEAVADDEFKADNDDDERRGKSRGKEKRKKAPRVPFEALAKARADMCSECYDVRTFGAVLANKRGSGGSANDKVTGPVQLGFARSIDPIITQRHSITRCAATEEEVTKENKTMGGKWTVPYALYRVHGSISASQAAKTGFSRADAELLWRSFIEMWRHDRSASRGEMAPRALVIFEHASKLGNAAPEDLYQIVTVERRGSQSRPPLSIDDYKVTIPLKGPEGVKVITRLAPREPETSVKTQEGSRAA
jgi:CRISPR-associated protein Csd2